MSRNKTRFELQQLAARYALSHQLGAMTMITFAHDTWCRMLKGGAICNCDPDVQVSEIKDIADDATKPH
jgi:hypothetical protein